MRVAFVVALGGCSFEHGGAPPADSGAVDARVDASEGIPADGPTSLLVEAEAWTTNVTADGVHAWTVDNSLGGYSGAGYVVALPTSGLTCGHIADTSCGAYSTYAITIPVTGMYRVTVRHWSPHGGSDSVYWYLGAAQMNDNFDPDAASTWLEDESTTMLEIPAGPSTLGLRMREAGARIDAIRIELQR